MGSVMVCTMFTSDVLGVNGEPGHQGTDYDGHDEHIAQYDNGLTKYSTG